MTKRIVNKTDCKKITVYQINLWASDDLVD